MPPKICLAQFLDHGLEESFLKHSGFNSMDALNPDNFKDLELYVKPQSKRKIVNEDLSSSSDSAKKPRNADLESSNPLFRLYTTMHVKPTRYDHQLSSYSPSSRTMDCIVHKINRILSDNYYFKKSCPIYHPYVFRLYAGIVFWIQCLRAGEVVGKLSEEQRDVLRRFTASHPYSSLPLPGPLVCLFKTLCATTPENPTGFGKVYPSLPIRPGPPSRSDFIGSDLVHHFLPNIPAIFALLDHLREEITAVPPRVPLLGLHTPVGENGTEFGFHSFPAAEKRTPSQKWALVCSGLQFPCEATAELNGAFAKRYASFNFPAMAANDDTSRYSVFFSMDRDLSWFSNVKEVATMVSLYCDESGTLADCSPIGPGVNQRIVHQILPFDQIPAPAHTADLRAVPDLGFYLSSSARNPCELSDAAAAMAQTHILMPDDHPFYGGYGNKEPEDGPFWKIRPVYTSAKLDSNRTKVDYAIFNMIKNRVKK